MTTVAVDAAATAVAARAVRARAIASNAKRNTGQGGLGAALFPNVRKLAIEAGVVLLVVAVGIVLTWKLGVRHVHNPRPLGGANVDVAPVPGSQTEAVFVTAPGHPNLLVGVDDGMVMHVSSDGGRTWRADGDAALTRLCTRRDPRVALDGTGRQYVAFIGSDLCEDELVPFLLVATRASMKAPWHVVRVTRHTWDYGFDDAPAIAVDQHTGTAYVAFTRSLGAHREAVVVSRSTDHGATWSDPLVVDPPEALPHLAQIAVGPNGDVYVAGIDAVHGIWAARSTDGARTFGRAAKLATLRANPSPDCARTGVVPVAQEERSCAGPNLNLIVSDDRVYAVYDDAAHVVLRAATSALRPLFRTAVTAPGKAQQLLPVAAVDSSTGTLWSCWYDTTFWPGGKKAWFTCSHSADGRRWSAPVRAAAVPSRLNELFVVYSYSGLVPSLVAAGGVAHPFWLDSRPKSNLNDIFTAAIPLKAGSAAG